jgi:hypothetical protein
MSEPNSQPSGKATTLKKLFSRQTSVAINIAAKPESIWQLLTNAESYTSWNSTILELSGKIAPGEKLVLRSTLAPDRKFNLKVKDFEPLKRLAWGDALGTRVFTLTPLASGETHFSMSETIGGPIFPLFALLIPSFDASFEQFAADLKKQAEKQS